MEPLPRVLEPEILDHLPASHPDAAASRRDLGIINAMLGSHRWLRRHIPRQCTVLELGAGDGRLCDRSGWTAVDLAPRPENWHEGATWIQGDVFDERNWVDADVVVANLFLHHFTEEQLRWIGRQVRRRARLFLACEPLRARLPMGNGALLAALCDFNHVTWNDMMISIRAGFRGTELAEIMGFEHGFQVTETLLGSYRFKVTL